MSEGQSARTLEKLLNMLVGLDCEMATQSQPLVWDGQKHVRYDVTHLLAAEAFSADAAVGALGASARGQTLAVVSLWILRFPHHPAHRRCPSGGMPSARTQRSRSAGTSKRGT